VINYFQNSFQGKGVIVTGAKGLLGSELCKALNTLGAKVIGLDLDEKTYTLIEGVDYYDLDISNEKSVIKFFNELKNSRLDFSILINNAGFSNFDHYLKRSMDDFTKTFSVNLKGNFLCTREFIKLTTKQNGLKHIVNIASVYGTVSPDFRIYESNDRRNSEIYGATKAGVIQLTKYFAVELAGNNFRVNCISPGGIYNPKDPQSENFIDNYSMRVPLKRMAQVDEIIPAILFFASDACSYITGQSLSVDGGYTIW
jgi:NAD(P)-dependent dehydrogenase (short-subunit alcohol dehydrogenase family)